MSFSDKTKDTTKDVKASVEKGIADAKDATREVIHRSNAEAEKTRREIEGDTMSPGEKIESVANEAKNRAQAEMDKAKRELRK